MSARQRIACCLDHWLDFKQQHRARNELLSKSIAQLSCQAVAQAMQVHQPVLAFGHILLHCLLHLLADWLLILTEADRLQEQATKHIEHW